MSAAEAAMFLDQSSDAVKSWSYGRRNPNATIRNKMRDLLRKQIDVAQKVVEAHNEKAKGQPINLVFVATDEEAREQGFPNVGAWRGFAACVVAIHDDVTCSTPVNPVKASRPQRLKPVSVVTEEPA